MKKVAFAVVGGLLVASSIAAVRSGGWAIVSVDQVPDYIVAGKPVTLGFVVRQHGVEALRGLSPSIVATSGSQRVEGRAWATQMGTYRGSVTVPAPGQWQITIHSGFGKSKTVLLPLRAVDSASRAPVALTEPERGRLLFAAKGCVSCHVHGEVARDGELKDAGPELTGKRFPPQYLAQFLADPSIKPPTPNRMRMPNFALREQEIGSLVAFINSERKLSAK